MFGTTLILITTILHLYVFWRISTLPFVKRHISPVVFWIITVLLWGGFYFCRIGSRSDSVEAAGIFEFLWMNWMAMLFLVFLPMFVLDLFTLFGLIFRRKSATLRCLALLTGMALSAVALVQGLRPPVIEKYEVFLAGLPEEMDGTILAVLSDLHLGAQLGESWLSERIDQVLALDPDIIVLLGDILEGHGPPADGFVDRFMQMSAPLGVWAVTGNHEYHGRGNSDLFESAGFRLMRDEWVEVKPGFIMAGVDDLTSRIGRNNRVSTVSKTLEGRKSGATVFLSHTPWQAEAAANAGVGLMLSGHTHGGQIWPFDYLVQQQYPLLEGRYSVKGMTVLVHRGTGTWGPRMRLWKPGVILQVVLRTESSNHAGKKKEGL